MPTMTQGTRSRVSTVHAPAQRVVAMASDEQRGAAADTVARVSRHPLVLDDVGVDRARQRHDRVEQPHRLPVAPLELGDVLEVLGSDGGDVAGAHGDEQVTILELTVQELVERGTADA